MNEGMEMKSMGKMPMQGKMPEKESLPRALATLQEAIALHQGHMDGSVPTSEESQEELMEMLSSAAADLQAHANMMKGDTQMATQVPSGSPMAVMGHPQKRKRKIGGPKRLAYAHGGLVEVKDERAPIGSYAHGGEVKKMKIEDPYPPTYKPKNMTRTRRTED